MNITVSHYLKNRTLGFSVWFRSPPLYDTRIVQTTYCRSTRLKSAVGMAHIKEFQTRLMQSSCPADRLDNPIEQYARGNARVLQGGGLISNSRGNSLQKKVFY